jgi:hypothetical protein
VYDLASEVFMVYSANTSTDNVHCRILVTNPMGDPLQEIEGQLDYRGAWCAP